MKIILWEFPDVI